MQAKKLKLESGKEVSIKEMSVDDIDHCNDLPSFRYENDKVISISNLAKARTAWIRKGVDGADDAFIKSLSDEDKNELSLAVQEHQRLGEKKPSH